MQNWSNTKYFVGKISHFNYGSLPELLPMFDSIPCDDGKRREDTHVTHDVFSRLKELERKTIIVCDHLAVTNWDDG